MKSPIFITGASRSGSSMIAGVFNLCGAFGGNMAVDGSNSRGMYENIRIRDSISKLILLKSDGDGEGQYPIPDKINIPTTLKSDVEQVMLQQGYKDGEWMYKDSRLTLAWEAWNYAFPDAKWIIVRRRTGDIVQSCIKTGFMKAFKKEKNIKALGYDNESDAWLWYVHQFESRFVDMITAGVNCRQIWPERMVHGDYKQLYETLDWLGLKWNNKIFEYIDPLLNPIRKKEMEAKYGSIGNTR